MNEDLLQNLPVEYAALADSRRVMHEVADELGELHAATTRLGDALESAGMPGRMWRSHDASLRLISRGLPDITVDRFMTRLSEFAAGRGPDWLHGNNRDLSQFHREVEAISRVVDRLRDSLRLAGARQPASARARAIELAFSDPRVSSVLDDVIEILGDFRALEPFMEPLTREEWASKRWQTERSAGAVGAGRDQNEMFLLSNDSTHSRLRDYARATLKPQLRGGPQDWRRIFAPLARMSGRVQDLLAPHMHGKRLVALVAALLVVTTLAVLTLHHQGIIGSSPTRGPSIGGQSATAASATNASATSAPVKVSPTTSRSLATKTPAPKPQLTLACAMDAAQTSATLTIKNTGRVAVSWQSTTSHGLTVSPSKGQLSVGQTDTAQVAPNSKQRGWVTKTVSVSASSGEQSISFSATCE